MYCRRNDHMAILQHKLCGLGRGRTNDVFNGKQLQLLRTSHFVYNLYLCSARENQ